MNDGYVHSDARASMCACQVREKEVGDEARSGVVSLLEDFCQSAVVAELGSCVLDAVLYVVVPSRDVAVGHTCFNVVVPAEMLLNVSGVGDEMSACQAEGAMRVYCVCTDRQTEANGYAHVLGREAQFI